MYLLSASVFLTVLFASARSDKGSDAADALSKASEVLKDPEKTSTLTKVLKYGQAAMHLGRAVMLTVQFINTFRPGAGETKELKFLKEQFAIVNTKLDSLDHEFEDVKNLIDWTTLRVNMMEYESNINALTEKLNLYIKAPLNAKKVYEDSFLTAFHYNFNDSPLKIYHSMVAKGQIFQDNLFEIARKQFQNDYRQVANFATYLMRLLQKGVSLQLASLAMKKEDSLVPEIQQAWKERFDNLEKIAKEVDTDIRNAWETQYRTDADAFAVRNSGSSNSEMASGIYSMLRVKFPWRRWFVLVYTFTDNNDKDRFFDNCNQFQKVNVGNKVVIVNSYPEEKTRSRISLKDFYNRIPYKNGEWEPYVQAAKKLYNMVPSSCNHYTFKGVFEYKADVQIRSIYGRYFFRYVHVFRAFHLYSKIYVLSVFD